MLKDGSNTSPHITRIAAGSFSYSLLERRNQPLSLASAFTGFPRAIANPCTMNTASNTSLTAMTAAQAQVAQSARQIGNPRTDESGVIEALIALKKAEALHAASASAARQAADMEQQLIDIMA